MDFEFPTITDGNLGCPCAVAAVPHELGDAAMQTGGRRRSPADAIGYGVENGEVFRAVGQQLAPKLERVFARSMGDFVDEGLQPDGILIGVDAAPEAHGHMRVAYGVLNQKIRNGVTKVPLRAARIDTLKRCRVSAIFVEPIGRGTRQNRGRRDVHPQSDEFTFLVETSRELAQSDRPISALAHILLAAPDQLDRNTRDLLGDQHGLGGVVLTSTPAEASTKVKFVKLALAG